MTVMGGPGRKEACPPIPMTPPPSICLMQLLRKRATDIKRHSVPRGGHGEGQDAGHWVNIQDGNDSDLSSLPHTTAGPMGTTMAEQPKVSATVSWGGSGATGPAAPFSSRQMGPAISLGESRGDGEQG